MSRFRKTSKRTDKRIFRETAKSVSARNLDTLRLTRGGYRL